MPTKIFLLERDSTLMGMLSNTGLKLTLNEMATNETDILKQLSEMRMQQVKTNLLMGNMNHLETYFATAKTDFEYKRFTWFVLTKVDKKNLINFASG